MFESADGVLLAPGGEEIAGAVDIFDAVRNDGLLLLFVVFVNSLTKLLGRPEFDASREKAIGDAGGCGALTWDGDRWRGIF